MRVLVDTGAQFSAIDRGLARVLKLRPRAALPILAYGVSGAARLAHTVKLDLELPGLQISGVRAAALDLAKLSAITGRGISLLLGRDALSNLVVEVDGPRSRATFHALMRESAPFNAFIVAQLAERLAQYVAIIEAERLTAAPLRVARSLAWLFNPVLYPGVGEVLRITQQELAYLVGLSRQRVNVALNALQQAQWIRLEYGGVRVLNLAALRSHTQIGRAHV